MKIAVWSILALVAFTQLTTVLAYPSASSKNAPQPAPEGPSVANNDNKNKPCASRGGECTTLSCGRMQFASSECTGNTHCCIWV
ncbi:MAG: hypothetical protein J3R72DRAFT_262734 [Linnemannia gamsii]|nr:MAG: hypothetical protein J3R72DRAFT_262734 [Linnemannia gamsii]